MHAMDYLQPQSMMNAHTIHPSAAVAQQVIDTLLDQIAREHYRGYTDIRFHQHRQALTHAICWPATWFKEKNIHICGTHYQAIIKQRLSEITTHASIHKTQTYFPNYLLKCLQNHFLYRGDSIYEQYKHVRFSIEIIMQKIPAWQQSVTNREMIDVLSQAHWITKPKRKTNPQNPAHQLSLDL